MLDVQKRSFPEAAVIGEILMRRMMQSIVPIVWNVDESPSIQGTGTLFEIENRHFLVTAAHIAKTNEDDLGSKNIDMGKADIPVALPSDRGQVVKLQPLGRHIWLQVMPPTNIDVAVIELLDTNTIAKLKQGWTFLTLDATAPYPLTPARFIVSGYLHHGASWNGRDIGQNFFTLATDPLLPSQIPEVTNPESAVDRFLFLQRTAQLLDGTEKEIPALKGMSGAAIWAYQEVDGMWEASKSLKIVGIQGSYLCGSWIRLADWEAVRALLRNPEVGLKSPP